MKTNNLDQEIKSVLKEFEDIFPVLFNENDEEEITGDVTSFLKNTIREQVEKAIERVRVEGRLDYPYLENDINMGFNEAIEEQLEKAKQYLGEI